jgi:RNA polymerase sigma-70 factor, ECF subfamily
VDSVNKDLTVAELVVAARGADAGAWAALIERFQDLAVAVSLGILTDPEAAQDAAQEAFLLAATHIGGLRDPAAFPGWFARVVRTACSRRLRALRPFEPLDERAVSDAADPSAGGTMTEEGYERFRPLVEPLQLRAPLVQVDTARPVDVEAVAAAVQAADHL